MRTKQIDTMLTCPECGHKCAGLFLCKDGRKRCGWCVKEASRTIKDIEMLGDNMIITLGVSHD